MATRTAAIKLQVQELGQLTKLQSSITALASRQKDLNKSIREATKAGKTNTTEFKRLNQQLASVRVNLKGARTNFTRLSKSILVSNGAIKKSRGLLASFRGALLQAGGALGVAFGVREILRFGAEAVALAGKVEGVTQAFELLGRPDLLAELQEATKGTVSNLQLMADTVKAENLGIPVEKLGKLFEFVRRRAKATGEEVSILQEKLVLGLGRKSVLRLDDLGVSATRIRDALGGVSLEASSVEEVVEAFTSIAQEELDEMGEDIDTTAEGLARLGAGFENFKVGLGEVIIEVMNPFAVIIGSVITGIDNLINGLDDVDEARKKFSNREIAALKDSLEINKRRNEILRVQGEITEEQEKRIVVAVVAERKAREEAAKKKADDDKAALIRTVELIRTEIKGEQKKIEAKSKRRDIIPIQRKIIGLEQELARLLGVLTKAEKELQKEQAESKKDREDALEKAIGFFNIELQARIDLQLLTAKTTKETVDAIEAQRIRDLKNLELTETQRLVIIEKAQQKIDALRLDTALRNQMAAAEISLLQATNLQQAADAEVAIQEARSQKILENTKLTNAERELETLRNEQAVNDIRQTFADLERERRFAEVQGFADIFSAFASITTEFAGLQKAAALFQIGVDTAKAISSLTANSSANPANAVTFGGAGAIQFATGIAQILANIARAKQIISGGGGFADGGFTGKGGRKDSSGHRVAGVVHGGEYVMPQRVLRTRSGAALASKAEGMRVRGFADGGFVTPVASSVTSISSAAQTTQSMADSIARRFANTVNNLKVTNVVSDTTDEQQSITNIQSEAGFGS